MSSLSLNNSDVSVRAAKPRWIDRVARNVVLKRLELLQKGCIVIAEDGQERTYGDAAAEDALRVHLDIRSPAFYSAVAFGGSVGSGEAYIDGHWDSQDIETLVRILLRNRDMLEGVDSGYARVATPLRKLFHGFNRNTRSGSRRNIAAHYDLGNEFYALWLDPAMMYSSAWFASESTSLNQAAVAKLDRICRKLRLSPQDRVIEIGTGWGGFAIHAAKHYGCHVTTTTISQQQYAYTRERVRAEGLEDRVTLLTKDYRDLEGQYDKLVSIEMVEAVGHEYLDVFFETCASLLKSDGAMLLQAITIADQRYEKAKTTVDFIKRYVFPGGFLPSLTAIGDSMTRCTDLRSIDVEDIGLHYALTLRHWRARFNERLPEVRRMGYSERFIRLWTFYLCYCEGAFMERAIGNVQLHAIKPAARPAFCSDRPR